MRKQKRKEKKRNENNWELAHSDEQDTPPPVVRDDHEALWEESGGAFGFAGCAGDALPGSADEFGVEGAAEGGVGGGGGEGGVGVVEGYG